MRLALLGSDPAVQSLLRDLPPEHSIVAAYEAREELLPLGALLPGVERGEQWESLLVRDDVDLVIVASPRAAIPTADGLDPQARRVDQLKKLAQAGKSLVISHPACDVLDAYELEMLRRDGGGVVLPWFSHLYHAAWRSLPFEYGEAGATEPIQWARAVDRFERDALLQELARDLFLIEVAVGKLARVTALGGPNAAGQANPAAWRSFTVQIATTAGQLVRWSCCSAAEQFNCRVAGGSGAETWELVVPASPAEAVELRERDGSLATWADERDISATLARFTDLQASLHESTGGDWLAACRSLEALAAVERSLARGRTIELNQAEQSEEYNFKGVMASAGCLLLLVMLLAVFVVALVEGLQLPLRKSPIWRAWPLALVVPLAIFLGLQFLQNIIEKPRNDTKTDSA